MKFFQTHLVLLIVIMMASPLLTACETREESIVRENGYIRDNPPEEVANYWRDVEFARPGGEPLTLDVSAPEGDGPFPILMIIHGGGWYLHTNTVMEGMARYVTNRGYVVFNINYRVTPDAEMEQIVEDCLGALIWIKEHAAEYKGDRERICVTGDSAGGHLTAMIVTQAEDPAFKPTHPGKLKGKNDMSVACAIPTYGVYDFVSLAKLAPSFLEGVMGAAYEDAPERYELLSPCLHVRDDLPPQLVIVGTADPLWSENKKYVKALKKAGAPVELWVYPGMPHAFLNDYWKKHGQKGYDKMIEFMDTHIK